MCSTRGRGTAKPGWKKVTGIRAEQREIWSRDHYVIFGVPWEQLFECLIIQAKSYFSGLVLAYHV